MTAIWRRELRSYYYSPIAYVFMGVVLFLFGVYDFQVVMTGSSYYIGQVYGIMFTWCMLFLPALTMKTLSEDRKNKTDQALITAPVSVTAIVWGKFLSAFTVYLITLAITLIPAFIIGATLSLLCCTARPSSRSACSFPPSRRARSSRWSVRSA